MIIILHGVVDIEIDVDRSTKVVIEHLGQGSIINPQTFLTEDKINCAARASTTATIYML